jgi:hypothetical protein
VSEAGHDHGEDAGDQGQRLDDKLWTHARRAREVGLAR